MTFRSLTARSAAFFTAAGLCTVLGVSACTIAVEPTQSDSLPSTTSSTVVTTNSTVVVPATVVTPATTQQRPSVTQAPSPTPTTAYPVTASGYKKRLLAEINKRRTAAGVAPATLSAAFGNRAQIAAEKLAKVGSTTSMDVSVLSLSSGELGGAVGVNKCVDLAALANYDPATILGAILAHGNQQMADQLIKSSKLEVGFGTAVSDKDTGFVTLVGAGR